MNSDSRKTDKARPTLGIFEHSLQQKACAKVSSNVGPGSLSGPFIDDLFLLNSIEIVILRLFFAFE
jgi:hypothetical protein